MNRQTNTLPETIRAEWSNNCARRVAQWNAPRTIPIDPTKIVDLFSIYEFIEALNDNMTSDHIVITDAGSPSYALPQHLKCKEGQRVVFSAAQADMGFAIPGSIGLSMSAPNKNVIVVTGDGSFMSNMQELATIKQLGLATKIFVLNNNGYLSIRNTQTKFYEGRVYGVSPETGVWFPNLYEIASAFKLRYNKLQKSNWTAQNMQAILESEEPIIIEVMCKPNEEILPTQAFKNGAQAPLDDMFPFLPDEEIEKERAL